MTLEKVIQRLQSEPWAKDETLKQEILGELRELESSMFEHIFRLCRSNSWQQRQQGYRLIGGLAAIEALWFFEDGKAEDLLIEALQDIVEVARVEAIKSLILIEEIEKTGKSIPGLINILKKDKKPDIRFDTALYLAFIRWDPRVTDALIEALEDHENTKRESLLMGTQYGLPVSVAATEALAKLGDKKGIAAIAPRVLSGMWTVQHTVEMFKQMGEPAVEHLIRGLEVESWQARERAVASLGEIGDERAAEPLTRMLDDEHWKVRGAAVEALGKLEHQGGAEVIALAVNDESANVRGKALEALRNMGEPATKVLVGLLQHSDSGVRNKEWLTL